MAINVKKVSGQGQHSSANVLKKWQKDKGESVGSFGGYLPSADRIPTGIFPLDLALGGGFPRGKCSIIYGPESSSKTNLALLAIAQHQRLWPKQVCVFADVEHALDPSWAARLGVDIDRLIVINPGYAEAVVDAVGDFLNSSDCGLVVIDSIAAMLTTSEGEASAERAAVGGATSATTKMYKKTVKCMSDAEKDGRLPTLLYINQTRYKIGVMFGDPETMPGGNAIRFQAGLWLRVYGKNIADPKVSTTMPVLKEVKFVVKKWKYPILSNGGVFTMAMLPYDNLKVGQCEDAGIVADYLKSFDLYGKIDKGGWLINGDAYKTQAEWAKRFYAEDAYSNALRKLITDKMLVHGSLLEEGEVPVDA